MPNLSSGLNLVIHGTETRQADIDQYIVDVNSQSTGLDVLFAEHREVPFLRLDVLVSNTTELEIGMDFCIAESIDAATRLMSAETSVLIAESRNCPANLEVLIDIGVQASLDILLSGTTEIGSGLQVYLKSEDLQIGASALYVPDADEVESVLYVEDGDILHPEYVEDMTATLMYRGKHNIGSVSFNNEHGTEDGTITVMWTHPAHRADLSVRYVGTVMNIGSVDFTVDVADDDLADVPLAENILEGIDNEQPRTEPDSSQALTHTLDAAPEEVEVMHESVLLTMFRLNLLSQYGWLEAGNEPIEYAGGGNRLLTALGEPGFVYQDKNAFPPPLNAHTRLEGAGTNLLSNSNFLSSVSDLDPTPSGWTLDSDVSVTALPTLVPDDSEINQLKVRMFGSGPFVGPKSMTLTYDAAVNVTPADPVTFSILARTEYGNEDVVIDHIRLIVSFRDAGDAEISQTVADFNPADIEGSKLVLLHNTVLTPPPGTVAARVWIDMNSIESSDDVLLYLMAPQLETSEQPTSRIVGDTAPTSRIADMLRVPQANNMELRRGSFITIFATDYDGIPVFDSCIFDTRDAVGLNGFALYHLANGKLRFMVAGPVSPSVLETNLTFEFTAGIFHEIGASWSTDFMEIQHNSERVAVDTSSIVLPQEFQEWVYLFRSTDGISRMEGELASFEIRRDVQE